MKKRTLLFTLLVFILVASCAVASAAYYHVSGTSFVKVRQLPYTSATVLGNYRQDYALTVTKKYGDWSYVHFTDGHEGYVMNKYIKSTASYKAYLTDDNTALRSGPATSFASVATLSKGTKVTVLSHGAAWDYVSTSNGNGYIRNSFLSKKYVAPSKKSGGYTAYVVAPNGGSVNIRKGAGKGYGVIGSVRHGNAVDVIEHTATWDKINYNGVTGYVMTQYLTKSAPKSSPSPAPTFAPAPTATPFVKYNAYVTSPNGKSVNVRKGPGTGYSNVYRLPVGTGVTVIKHQNNSWDYIEWNGQKGYIMRKYLCSSVVTPTPAPSGKPTSQPTAEPTPFSPYYAFVTSPNGKSVNVRNGAGAGYGTVCALKVGTQVYVIGTAKGGWSKISTSDHSGYIMTKFLSTSEPIPDPVPDSNPDSSIYPYSAWVVSTNGEDVNMRQGPGVGYSNVTRLPVNSYVIVLSESNGWCKIEANGLTGYMKKQFLTTNP